MSEIEMMERAELAANVSNVAFVSWLILGGVIAIIAYWTLYRWQMKWQREEAMKRYETSRTIRNEESRLEVLYQGAPKTIVIK